MQTTRNGRDQSPRDPARVAEKQSPRSDHGKHAHSGTKKLLGNQTLVGNMTSVKVGGRKTCLPYPPDVAKSTMAASESFSEAKKLLAAPSEDLNIEYAYGFNGTCRDNLHAIGPGACLYNIGCLGVVFDFEKNQQTFFAAHSEEVTAIAFCRQTRLVATGQRSGQEPPRISLWSVDDPSEERHRLLGHQYSLYSLAFSTNGKWLFSVGAEGGQAYATSTKPQAKRSASSLGDSKSGQAVNNRRANSSQNMNRGNSSPVFVWEVPGSAFRSREQALRQQDSSIADSLSVTGSPKLRFSKVLGSRIRIVPHPTDDGKLFAFSSRTGTFLTSADHSWASADSVETQLVEGLDPQATILCAVFSVSQGHDLLACGGIGGVYVIKDCRCIRTIPMFSGMSVNFMEIMGSGDVACGGEDGGISFLSADLTDFSYPRGIVCDLGGRPIEPTSAECFTFEDGSDELLVGTRQGAIIRIKYDREYKIRSAFTLQKTPSGECEVTALCASPHDANRVAIADKEGRVRFFDARRCHMLQVPPYSCRGEVTCMTWNPEGRLLVAGLSNGNIEGILCLAWMGMATKSPPRCEFVTKIPEDTSISTVRISPGEGRYLAAGSTISGTVHIFHLIKNVKYDEARAGDYYSYRLQMLHSLSGNATACLCVQFSKDEAEITSNARDGQVLCWETETGKRLTPSLLESKYLGEGAQFQLTISWPMIGIWNDSTYTNTTDIVAEASNSNKLAAVGDKNGRVKLHRFPLPLEDASAKVHCGHSSRVSVVSWTKADRVVSVGTKIGDGLLQWRLSTAEPLELYTKRNRKENPNSGSHLNIQDDKTEKTPKEERSKNTSMADVGDAELWMEVKRRWGNVMPVDAETQTEEKKMKETAETQTEEKKTKETKDQNDSLLALAHEDSSLLAECRELVHSWRDGFQLLEKWDTDKAQRPLSSKSKNRTVPSQGSSPAVYGRVASCPSKLVPAVTTPKIPSQRSARLTSPRTPAMMSPGTPLRASLLSPPRAESPPIHQTLGAWQFQGAERKEMHQTLAAWQFQGAERKTLPAHLSFQPPVRVVPPHMTTTCSSIQNLIVSPWSPGKLSPARMPPQVTTGEILHGDLTSEYSAFLRSADGHELAEAAVFLYHPPFWLNKAITYAKVDDQAVENFHLPRGWGVLRSRCGLLVWLHLRRDAMLGEASAAQNSSDPLFQYVWARNLILEFQSCEFTILRPLSITLRAASRVSGKVELADNEGLLHPSRGLGDTQVKLALASDFGVTVKRWLSEHVLHSEDVPVDGRQRRP